tara:strand:+ start:1516 stop:1947 length:432 start_codon:yes stop_codon:yes gene_type:complete
MPLHIIKLCVGVSSIGKLREIQAKRMETMRQRGQTPLLRHITRNRPRRMREILAGGSMYWVIKGYIRARQRIVAFEEVDNRDDVKRCGIMLDSLLIETELQPRRPHQGWRYLEPNDAPRDVTVSKSNDLPPELVTELEALGLI